MKQLWAPEEVKKLASDVLDDNIKVNPTLEGDEETMSSFEFKGTKYIVGGGTEVVANPTLEGTEDPLEGLEVEGVKYKVPEEATYYNHNINVDNTIYFTVITKSSTPFTFLTLKDYLFTNESGQKLEAHGYDSTNKYLYYAIYDFASLEEIRALYINLSTLAATYTVVGSIVSDTVVEIK